MASTFLQGYIQETTGYIYHIDTNYRENLCNTQGWLQWKPVHTQGWLQLKTCVIHTGNMILPTSALGLQNKDFFMVSVYYLSFSCIKTLLS